MSINRMSEPVYLNNWSPTLEILFRDNIHSRRQFSSEREREREKEIITVLKHSQLFRYKVYEHV